MYTIYSIPVHYIVRVIVPGVFFCHVPVCVCVCACACACVRVRVCVCVCTLQEELQKTEALEMELEGARSDFRVRLGHTHGDG